MLSVLIVNWNTRDQLSACLASLKNYAPTMSHEVIVVDNDSTDVSAEMVRKDFPSVVLIQPGKNTGYAGGNNLAFGAAKGDYLLTLNPDTELLEPMLDEAVNRLARENSIGSLSVRLQGVDGETQSSVRGFPSALGIIGDITGLGKLFPHSALGSYRLTAFDYDKEQLAPQPMGTFLLFKRSALEQVGDARKPFDEQFPIFFNEVDLLFRLQRVGRPCLYVPNLRILHHGGASTIQRKRSMIWESHRSLVRFLRKHNTAPWQAPGLAMMAGLIYLGAWIRARGYDAGFRT